MGCQQQQQQHQPQSIQLINSNNCRLETITINNHLNDENAFKLEQNNPNSFLHNQHSNADSNSIILTNSNSSNGLTADDLLLNGKANLLSRSKK